MSLESSTEALNELGFTRLEAEIYVFLLRHPSATGYRVAKGVGRTNANTYKALESLQAKGAVLVEEGANRLCRAVPAEELLGQLRSRFETARQKAEDALRDFETPPNDDGIYHLRSRQQVFERARRMLDGCRHIALIDVYPALVEELRQAIEDAVQRGVRVSLKVYAPVEIGSATVIYRRRGHEIVERMPDDHLGLNVDGREHLTVGLDRTGGEAPLFAIWTASPALAYGSYNSLIHELILTDLRQAIWDDADNTDLRALLDQHAYLHPASSQNPVYQGFLKALGRGPRGKANTTESLT